MDGSSLMESGNGQFVLTATAALKRHEEMDLARARALLDQVTELGFWTHPLLVEDGTDIILDGHHRFWCAGELGLERIPTYRISYGDPALSLSSWREGVSVTPDLVIAAAMNNELLPKKTSKHVYAHRILSCNIPLTQLKQRIVA